MDRYGDGGESTLNIYYEAFVRDGMPTPGSDVIELGWFRLDQLPAEIAFDNNRQALLTLTSELKTE